MVKIDKNEFKRFHNSDKIVTILEQMTTSSHPIGLAGSLMDSLRESGSLDAYGIAFKYVVWISQNSRSLSFIEFIADFKCILQRTNMNDMSDDVLRNFIIEWGSITREHGFNLSESDVPEWESHTKSYFMLTMTKLHSLHYDTVGFLFNGMFQDEFGVRCPQCSNEEEITIGEKIEPVSLDNILIDKYMRSNTPILMYNAYHGLGEETLSEAVPYLYGRYPCSKCGKSSTVMNGVMNHIYSQGYLFIPNEEYIDRLFQMLNKWDYNQLNWHFKLWSMAEYYASQCQMVYGLTSLKAQKELVRSAVRVASLLGNDFPTEVANNAIQYLENSYENDELKADLHFWIGYAIAYGWDQPREVYEKAIYHYRKAEELFIKLYGEENENVTKCRNNIAQVMAEMPEGDMTMLVANYEKLKANPNATLSEIARAEHVLAEAYEERGEYAKAIEMEQSTLIEYIEEYGEKSDMVADHKERIAELYEKMGNSEEALKILEESAEIHIREMGREYMLPPLFRNLIHKGKKLFNVAEKPDPFAVRVRSVSGVYQKLGDIYLSLEDPKTALNRYEKAMDLFTWVSVPVGIEMVHHHFKIASALYCLERDNDAIKHYNKSLEQLHWTLRESQFPEERNEAERMKSIVVGQICEVLSTQTVTRNQTMEILYQEYGI